MGLVCILLPHEQEEHEEEEEEEERKQKEIGGNGTLITGLGYTWSAEFVDQDNDQAQDQLRSKRHRREDEFSPAPVGRRGRQEHSAVPPAPAAAAPFPASDIAWGLSVAGPSPRPSPAAASRYAVSASFSSTVARPGSWLDDAQNLLERVQAEAEAVQRLQAAIEASVGGGMKVGGGLPKRTRL